MRRLLCVLLSICLFVSVLSTPVSATEPKVRAVIADVISLEKQYSKTCVYIYDDVCYMDIADISAFTRSSYSSDGNVLAITHGTRSIDIDLSSGVLHEDGITANIKTIQYSGTVLIHAYPILTYLGATCEVENDRLIIDMPPVTLWEGLVQTGTENYFTLETFGSEIELQTRLLLNGILKILDSGISSVMFDSAMKEAFVLSMQVDPMKYDGGWEEKNSIDERYGSLISAMIAADEFSTDFSELFEQSGSGTVELVINYLEEAYEDDEAFIQKLKNSETLFSSYQATTTFLSNLATNKKCTVDSLDMLKAFSRHTDLLSDYHMIALDAQAKVSNEFVSMLEAGIDTTKEAALDEAMDLIIKNWDDILDGNQMVIDAFGESSYFGILEQVTLAVDISVWLHKIFNGEHNAFDYASAETASINLLKLKNEIAKIQADLAQKILNENYSDQQDLEDYRLLSAFYYKVLIAANEQLEEMIIAQGRQNDADMASVIEQLHLNSEGFAKNLYILTMATGTAFPDLVSISASNEWDSCRTLKDKATEITETDDLAMYHLSMQSGQYAISGDYKYYTIQTESGEMEPTGDLYKENIKTGERILLKENTLAQFINVVNDKVFYTLYGSGPYNVGVHMISTDGTGYKQLTDQMVCSLVADDTYVYFAEDPFATEFSTSINRIAYSSDAVSTETVIPSVSGYVYDINLLSGRLVYSEVKTAVDMNTRIVIFDLSSKSKTIINDGDGNPEVFEEMWVHGNFIYILKWHGHFYGSCAEYELSEAMKRDLYRYNLTTKEYEICELPVANYEELFAGFYLGDIYSGILDDFEKELPSDFENSARYDFVSIG